MTMQEIERLLMQAAKFRQELPPVPTMVVEHEPPKVDYGPRFRFPDGKVYELPSREMNALLDCVRALYKIKSNLAPVGWAILMNAAKQ